MATRPSIPNESYYRDGRTSETERITTTTIPVVLTTRPRQIAAGVLIGLGIFLLGWHMRELFALPYDYTLLVWLVPLATFLVAWGNRRTER